METPGIPQRVKDRVLARSGRVHPFDTMVPSRTAVIVIDMQMHFMAEGAAAELPLARDIVPAINRLTELARQSGATVVWIKTVAEKAEEVWPIYVSELLKPEIAAERKKSLEGQGQPLWPDLIIDPQDVHVDKIKFSAFSPHSSSLLQEMTTRGIDTLLIAGVATNTCCEATARDAMMLNFRTVMVSDALASRTEEDHLSSLTAFYNSFGDVQTVDEVRASLQNTVERA